MKNNKPQVRFNGFDEDWEERDFSQIINLQSGRDYKHLSDGNIPVYGTGGYMTSVNKALSYNEDSIGIGRKGTIDKPFILRSPFWTVDTLFYAVPKPNNDLEFLNCIFQKVNWKKKDESTGVPSLSKTTINSVLTNIPDKTEQNQIGTFFKNLDKLLTEHQQKHSKLKTLKKAMLAKMFPQQGQTVPEIRFKGFSGDWEEKILGDIMNVTSVKRIHQSDWTVSGVRFLRARDLVSYSKNEKPSEYLYISDEKYKEYSLISGKVKEGDILVTGVGTIGVPFLVKNIDPIYFKDGNIIWFKNENIINGDFLYFSFTNRKIQNFIKDSAGTGTVGTYTIESGKKTPLIFPKNEGEQKKIGDYFKNLDELVENNKLQIEKLQNIKKAFLAKMFI